MATIDLQFALIEQLRALAQSEGVSLEVYLERVASLRPIAEAATPISGDQLEQLLDAEALENSIYQGIYSRADIYRDHD